ncbi:uncharacterized protein LOC132544784 [Ylistrum balloti]|uniref:uncharacterized protein LOC132544784 n=1 Tax=Ylistrum balloti TaxID=509963 RepID=UPI002905DD4D|nr:uncharacterized protein LOC132544784 [Ylistrum balloti]
MAAQDPVPGCSQHPGMGFVYVCKTCDNQLICMDCVVGYHNQHDLGKLTEHILDQKRQIRQFQEKLLKTDIPKLEKDIEENDERFDESSEQLRKVIDDIKSQGESIKTEIDRLIEKSVKLCRELVKANSEITVKNKTTLIKHVREVIRPRLARCQQVVTSGSNFDVITVAKEVRCTSTAPPDVGSLKTAVFKPGTVHTGHLEGMLGTVLFDSENPVFQSLPKTTLVSSFKAPFQYDVCHICGTGDEAWLSYWNESKIYRVDQKGDSKERIKCKVKVESISVSPTTGRVWFCVKEDKSIRECTSDGKMVIRFKVESAPRSLCTTREDMVVVGMKGGIFLYAIDGRRVTHGAGSVCRQKANVPNRITCCPYTGNIAAVDNDGVDFENYINGKEQGKQPRVILMDNHLDLKFQCRYLEPMNLQTGESQQSKFYPRDVCFDGGGDVLTAEGVTKSVMLIDGDNGHFLRTIYVCDVSVPRCISLQGDRVIWIGDEANTFTIMKYR